MNFPAKERILTTASRLFYNQGINRTGIDQIILESQVAKATFYSSYSSKEELIVNYLETQHETFVQHVAERSDMWAPFEGLENLVESGDFMGCPFANALAELPHSEPIAKAVRDYRNSVLNYFQHVAKDEGVASELMVIYDGAFLACKLEKAENAMAVIRSMVAKVSL